MQIIKRRGPSIELCGTPKCMLRKSLRLVPSFFLFQLFKQTKMKFGDSISNSCGYNLAISSLSKIQSKAFD